MPLRNNCNNKSNYKVNQTKAFVIKKKRLKQFVRSLVIERNKILYDSFCT